MMPLLSHFYKLVLRFYSPERDTDSVKTPSTSQQIKNTAGGVNWIVCISRLSTCLTGLVDSASGGSTDVYFIVALIINVSAVEGADNEELERNSLAESEKKKGRSWRGSA